MDSSIYIPKWLIAAFLAAVGCVVGWMFGAADLVTASIGAPEPAEDSADAPAVDVVVPEAGGTAGVADAAAPVADAAAPVAATAAPPPPELALYGAASTTNSTVRITSTPDGHHGVATTPNSTVRIDAVPTDPAAPGSPATTAAAPAPIAAPATAANSAAAPAPAASTTAAPAPPPVTAQPQVVMPQMAPSMMAMPGYAPVGGFGTWQIFPPVTGIGSWGPPQPLPPLVSPPLFAANLWNPLPGATSRGVAFAEWESYRTDVAGRNILVTTDDSNFFRDRYGLINANTGDIDASGLNVIDAADSVIRGSESADEAPWQTMAAALVDLAGSDGGVTPPPGGDDDDDDDDDDDEDSDELNEAEEPNGDVPPGTPAPVGSQPSQGSPPTSPAATPLPATGGDDDGNEGFDFPYETWVEHANAGNATAVHTDEGTTLASGSDAIVIGADGYDDDDNRAVGENIVITRDDGNVVVGGVGNVNAQIGDAEQGVLVMDVDRTFIQGGGAY